MSKNQDYVTLEWSEEKPSDSSGMCVYVELGPGCANAEYINSISFVNEGLHSKVVVGKNHIGHTIRPGEERSYGFDKEACINARLELYFEFEDQRQYNADGSRPGVAPTAADAIHKVVVCKIRPVR
jgi:hypothetical protein